MPAKKKSVYKDDEYNTTEAAPERALEKGLAMISPGPRDILLDLDTPEDVEKFDELYDRFHKNLGISLVTQTVSKSGNTHVYLKSNTEISNTERLLIQAALGSDPKRELLGLLQLRAGIKHYSQLFETKQAVLTVIEHYDMIDFLQPDTLRVHQGSLLACV